MIELRHVTLSYGSKAVLRDVSFSIPDGDLCLVIGRTGTGKSTLLGLFNGLVPNATGGAFTGRILLGGRDVTGTPTRDLAATLGYVGQDPVRGFVTDTVEEEIAYGMEQLGVDPQAMRKRVEETLDLLGIADLRGRPLADLSGGQQQRVAIASVLAAQPRILVLDEPTSALDPTAAHDVVATLTTLVREVGLTVVLAEHRLERVMDAADSMIWLPGDGRAVAGDPSAVLAVADVTPPLAELAHVLRWTSVPLSVRDARRRVQREQVTPPEPRDAPLPTQPVALAAADLRVRYGAVTALKGANLVVAAGTVTSLMGRNGAGKSSLLWALQGGVPSTGTVTVAGRDPRTLAPGDARRLVSLVPQTAADLLYLPTVADECHQADVESSAPPGSCATLLADLGITLDPTADPWELSEGQRLALVLAVQLTAQPSVVLLDEPTRGLDYTSKAALADLVARLAAKGTAVVIATHDVEFAARASQRTIVMAEGEIVADGPTREICTSSAAYAPQTAKVFAPFPVLVPREVAP